MYVGGYRPHPKKGTKYTIWGQAQGIEESPQ